MPARLLAEYTHSAHGYDNQTADELRYFLARYFELIALATRRATSGSRPASAGCTTRAGARAGRPRRSPSSSLPGGAAARAARAPPRSDPTGFPVFESDQVEEVLCMAAHAGSDLRSLLALCDAEGGRRRHAAHRQHRRQGGLARATAGKHFLARPARRPDIEIAMRDVLAWLLTPEMRERLEDACLAEQDQAAAALLSHAESLVMSAIRKGVDDLLRRLGQGFLTS